MPRVLVVDDEVDIQLLLRTALSVLGDYDVTTVSSGAEAVTLAANNRFDVVLLDAMMPEMDGFSVLGRLRSQGTLESTCVIMLTAQGGESEHKRAYEGGADAYLTKPFAPDHVAAVIDAVLARSPTERDQVRRDELEKARLLAQLERRFD